VGGGGGGHILVWELATLNRRVSITRDDNIPAAITGHNYGNFYVGSYTVSASYPSDAFHTHGPKEVLTVSLFFSVAANAKLNWKGKHVFLKTSWDSDNMKLVNRLCPRTERNAYVSRHLYTLFSCIGATLFHLCYENYLSTDSVCV